MSCDQEGLGKTAQTCGIQRPSRELPDFFSGFLSIRIMAGSFFFFLFFFFSFINFINLEGRKCDVTGWHGEQSSVEVQS